MCEINNTLLNQLKNNPVLSKKYIYRRIMLAKNLFLFGYTKLLTIRFILLLENSHFRELEALI